MGVSLISAIPQAEPEKKFKPHYREVDREARLKNIEQDREQEYQRLLSDWKRKERDFEESKIEMEDKQKKREAELPQLIKEDLDYDSADDKYNKASEYYSKHQKGKSHKNSKFTDKKKAKRKREAERDQEDKLKEQEEIKIAEEKRIEEQKKLEEQQRIAEERKRRPKSRFTEIKDSNVPVQAEASSDSAEKKDTVPHNLNINAAQEQNVNNSEIPQAKLGEVKQEDYYVPNDAPPGAIPLRLPNNSMSKCSIKSRSNQSVLGNPVKDVEMQDQPAKDQSRGFQSMDVDEDVKNEAPKSHTNSFIPQKVSDEQKKNVANHFIQPEDEYEDPNVHGRNAKNASGLLNDRLQQIEAKKSEMATRVQEQQKSANLEDYNEEDKKKILNTLKEIYASLPKHDDEILAYPLNWDVLISLNIIDLVMHKIVSKRVKKILHVEEPSLIKWVIDALKKKPVPKFMKTNLYNILDDETDDFVVSIWKAMIFENIKFDKEITKEPFKMY